MIYMTCSSPLLPPPPPLLLLLPFNISTALNTLFLSSSPHSSLSPLPPPLSSQILETRFKERKEFRKIAKKNNKSVLFFLLLFLLFLSIGLLSITNRPPPHPHHP